MPDLLQISPNLSERQDRNIAAAAPGGALPLPLLRLIFAFLLALHTIGQAESAGNGVLLGRVVDEVTGRPLPGANVLVEATILGDATTASGRFRIATVPAGTHRVIVSYLGYRTETLEITVTGGETVSVGDVPLQVENLPMAELLVEGIREGQARALNLQRSADNIKTVVSADLVGRFPDPNAAEALQRVSGVVVQRDQGEGRYVQLRGTGPRLTSVTLDGEEIPSPEGGVRHVALDVIPADQLASIEVNRTLTPDMDADGIGGSINLTTRQAYDTDPVLKATLATGYTRLSSDANFQGSLTYGRRSGPEGTFGYLFSGSYYRTDRGSDNNEFEWGTEDFGAGEVTVLEDFQIRDYLFTRTRLGLSGALDYRLEEKSSLYLRGMFNRFGDQEYQRRLRFRFDKGDYESRTEVSSGRVERKLKDRYEEQDIYSIKAGGRHTLATVVADYGFSYAYAREVEPDRRDILFRQKKVDLAYDPSDPRFPVVSVSNGRDIFDPGAFDFTELELEDNLTWERKARAKIDLEIPYGIGGLSCNIKLGAKVKRKQKVELHSIGVEKR